MLGMVPILLYYPSIIYPSLFDVTSTYPLKTLAALGFLMPSQGTEMQHCKEMS